MEHWESYYRSGRLAACPTGGDANYTLELRDAWVKLFGTLADGARILDIGTGNGAIPLIARQTAHSLGRTYEIHGADVAQINPIRDVAGGAQLFAGITFHPGVAAEKLRFETASFTVVTSQFALEYSNVEQSLAQIFRVLQPGGAAQFIIHHADSIVVARARESLRHADIVLMQTKVHRKLRRFLDSGSRSSSSAQHAWAELESAMATLRASGCEDGDRRIIDVTLDAIPKLLDLRRTLSHAALAREVDSVERDLRSSVRRLHDLITAAMSDDAVSQCTKQALTFGFVDVAYGPMHHAQYNLVGWKVNMRKPL